MMNLVKVWLETEHTLRTFDLCKSCVSDSIEHTVFYPEDEDIFLGIERKKGTKVPKNVVVSDSDTFTAAGKLSQQYKGKIAVLNFANAYHPGGGVLIGASAQEEDLCRVSTLYPVLASDINRKRFYEKHNKCKSANGTSDILYSPEILVFRFNDDQYTYMTPDEFFCVDVITCAAPQLPKGFVERAAEVEKEQLYQIHLERGRRIIESAVKNGVKVLVLGAFGCGAFQNDPCIVAKAYRELMISYAHYFERIEFAVYCTDAEERNYKVFKKILK